MGEKRKRQTVLPYVTSEQVERIINAARSVGRHGARDALMIRMGYRHGFRASELLSLKWTQVNLERMTLDVERLKGSLPSKHDLSGPEVRELRKLQRGPGRCAFVFVTERGGPMTRKTFDLILSRAGERAGIEQRIHSHMLRHGCGYALANRGVDTRAIQAWLGHSNIAMTVRYTALAEDRLRGIWGD
jgi:type 1 fimbriae regulatory protein FimB/type 1 fimbriae regulatory protein FimE